MRLSREIFYRRVGAQLEEHLKKAVARALERAHVQTAFAPSSTEPGASCPPSLPSIGTSNIV